MANLVTFAKKLWKDATSGGTPITAAELNRIEGGVNDCATQINRLGDSVSRYKYGTIAARVEANSTWTIDVNLGSTPNATFANAMSANKAVRAQAKTGEGGTITIVVINGESYVWEGSVSWFAII